MIYFIYQDEVLQLKRIAFKNAKEVRKFWIKINKVISFKQKIDADAVRQKVSFLCGHSDILSLQKPVSNYSY
jgi:hypothetical protein